MAGVNVITLNGNFTDKRINDYDFIYQKRVIERKFWREIADELRVSQRVLSECWKDFDEFKLKKKQEPFILSEEALENFDGWLLGDGSNRPSKVSADFNITSSHSEAINFVGVKLASYGIMFSKNLNRYVSDERFKEGGSMSNSLRTRKDNVFFDMYHRFYLSKYKFCAHCEILFHLDTVNYNE